MTTLRRRIINRTGKDVYFVVDPPRFKDLSSNKNVDFIGLYEWRTEDKLNDDDRWIFAPDTVAATSLKKKVYQEYGKDKQTPVWISIFTDDMIFLKRGAEVIMEYPAFGAFLKGSENNYKVYTTSIGNMPEGKLQKDIDKTFPKEYLKYKYYQDKVLSDTLFFTTSW